MFTLDARLAADTVSIADLKVSQLRLMNDTRFPWLVLVPRIDGASELHDLNDADFHALMQEVRALAKLLKKLTSCNKINVAALGNKVQQLHIHIIARSEGDAAWPGAVWDKGQAIPYTDSAREVLVTQLRASLK